ncbi:helix-turn-helix domain-containing protein [Paenibacillus ginsengarvi]|uniref:AraC family transcriptional regulator n=1 Tax=Paenibacillus ginsengarvi TaxID=400777 RepID=A0A3B0CLE8_9BACL|nr:AraC family transcriptional regulator [Paenibacillus ginsengarvi]RKN85578.1 AraC family transcriptional regulator [Paenibacillus ginsengarvi]
MSAESFLWDVDVNVYWAGLQYLPDTWSFRDKKNPHIRLWVVQKGEVAANIQGKPYTVKKGEAVLFPAAESVHFRSVASGELHLLSVLFTLQSRTGYRYRSLPGVPTMLSNLDMRFMETHMMEVVEEIEQRRIGYKMGANSILQSLLVHILRAGNYKEPQQADAWIDVDHKAYLLGLAVKMLQDNPARFPTVKQLADMVSVSEVHLRRLFHKYYRMSPSRFVRHLKVQESKHMLRDTSVSISEIAYSLGFESPNYFSKVFQQENGCSPSDFRQLLRNRD